MGSFAQPVSLARPEGDARLDLRHYAQLLWRMRLLLAVAAALGLGLGILYGTLQTPQYRAAAMLQIEPPTPMFMNMTDALVGAGGYWQNADFYNTQFKILKSKGLGDKVVSALKLKEREPFKSDPDAAGLLLSHLAVEPIPESRLVNVLVTHTDPREAATWANTVADLYIKESVSNRMEQARQVLEWLNEQVKTTQESMQTAQTELIRGMQGQDLVVPEGSQSAASASIQKLNEEYIEARSRRIEVEAALRQVNDLREQGGALDSVPQVASDSQVMQLNGQIQALELQLSTLRGRFREGHPEVAKTLSEIKQTRKALADRANEVVAGLESRYAQLRKQEGQLQGAIGGQRSVAVEQSRKAAELESLKKRTESTKNLYDVLLQKLNETNIAASMHNSNASVVERAIVPVSPVRPQKRRVAAFGLLIGLACGVGLVLLRDYLDNTFRDAEEVERYLHTDLLAAIPKAGDARLQTEAYQNLRTALLFARKGEEGQVVLVTGTAPQEGKTTTIVNLGKLLASSGEMTLLVDCDLRRAQIHSRLGLPREPGFTNFFTQHVDIDTLVQSAGAGAPKLFALTAGPLPPNPPALLAREQLGDLLKELRGHFRWVLIDSPPLASVTDALLLARLSDIVLVVVQHNRVDKRLVKRAVAALRRVTPNLLGVVLNLVEFKTGNYYYYYHHQEPPTDMIPREASAKPKKVAAGKG